MVYKVLYKAMPLSIILRALVVMYPKWGTIAQIYHDQDTFDFSPGHVTKNQPRQSLF